VGGLDGCPVVRALPISALVPGRYQPRGDGEDGVVELVQSVREHGVLQPVVVRPVNGGYELVAGERRWRAAELAGLTTVPAVVREMSDHEAAVLGLVENLQRKGLGFFEEAEAFRRLLDEFRISQEELARELGVSQPTVANKLRLLRLEPEVRRAVTGAGLSERHARALLRLGTAGERLEAAGVFASRNMTVQQAEAWVERRIVGRSGARTGRAAVREIGAFLDAIESIARDMRRAGFGALTPVDEDEEGWTLRMRVVRGARERGAGRRRA
jgi:ParB family chromosome partitioning protein